MATTSIRVEPVFAPDLDEGVDTRLFAQSRTNQDLYIARDVDWFRLYINPLRGGGLMRVDHLLGTDFYRQFRLRRDGHAKRGLAWIDPSRAMLPGELANAIGHIVKGIDAQWTAYVL